MLNCVDWLSKYPQRAGLFILFLIIMVLLSHQSEHGHQASSEYNRTGLATEHNRTGLANIYGTSMMRTWSFKRKQKKLATVQEQKPEHYFKLVLLGDCSTGKTSFANTFSCNACSLVKKPPVGSVKTVEYVDRVLEVQDKQILARLYDTAGQEKFRSLTASYYRGVHGCLVLFDVSKEITFNNLSYWLYDLKEYSSCPNIPTVLVGTGGHVTPEKREVSIERAMKYAESVELPYMEVNITEDNYVVSVVERLLELILEKLNNDRIINEANKSMIILNEKRKPRKQWCSC